jgi:hypothetical protein
VIQLNRFFYEFDVADILRVRMGVPGVEDRVAWDFTKDGVFSVAYHLQMQCKALFVWAAAERETAGPDRV